MAISLSNISTLIPKPLFLQVRKSSMNLTRTPLLNLHQHRCFPSALICRATVREEGHQSSSMSSLITELQREQSALGEKEEEKFLDQLDKFNTELADRWQELHGRDDWVGLLDPMDRLLRSELIRYGEFAQACYDAFDFDPFSRYCGSSRYSRRSFFNNLDVSKISGSGSAGGGGSYEVTRFVYATSNLKISNFFTRSRWPRAWSDKANWIGFIAVSDDEATRILGRRDIVIAWRGTVTKLEWVADLMDFLRPVAAEGINCPDPDVKVESGFVDYYTDKDRSCRFCKYSAREQVLSEVSKLVKLYANAGENISISVTGHSLGSALATLSAYDIVEMKLNVIKSKNIPVTVFSFSGPRVGNRAFKERFESLGIKCLRVVNVHDTVPKMPGLLFNERIPAFVQRMVEDLPWSYCHVGVELALDHRRSPFLKETGDPACLHNLEAHLHLLDGYHGRGERFKLASGRDPALVNKACDFLKDHHMVPPFWRQDQNKGMIRSNDGRWIVPERQKIDDHPPDMHQHLTELGFI